MSIINCQLKKSPLVQLPKGFFSISQNIFLFDIFAAMNYLSRTILFITTLLLCLSSGILHAQLTFQKTYGGINLETCYDAKQTNDKGYIMVGQTYSFGAGYGDVYLIKTDSTGDTLWTRTYGGAHDDGGYHVEQTADTGYIIIGYTFSFGTGGEDVYIIKTNSVGDTLWTETFGGFQYDIGRCIRQTNEGGYIFTGTTYSYNPTLYLVKLNNLGTPVWVQTYGGDTLLCEGNDVQQTSDGGYVIIGNSYSFAPDPHVSDVYLVKTDHLGILQWSKSYGGNGNDYGNSVQQTNDGGYIIAGTTYSFGAGNGDIYLLKTDASGNLSWSHTYGGPNPDEGLSVQQADDGGYLIAGTTNNFIDASSYVCLFKTDGIGTLLWADAFGGGSCSNTGVSVHQTNDGGCIVGGTTCSYPDTSIELGGDDFYLMKTEYFNEQLCSNGALNFTTGSPQTFTKVDTSEHGPTFGTGGYKKSVPTQVGSGGSFAQQCFQVGIKEQSYEEISTTVFPDPCKDFTTITIKNIKNNPSGYDLYLFDVMGKAMNIKYTKNNAAFNSISFILNTNNVCNGVYFCKVSGDDFIKTIKVFVNK